MTMKFRIISLIAALIFSSISFVAIANVVAPAKNSPDVSFEKVQEIFGNNVNPTDSTLKLLLLAIAMDGTATTSTFKDQKIGIPYIVETGPSYWVNKLKAKDHSLDVLVNNALILLFAKEDISNREKGAAYLMQLAEEKSYWPASFYLAEKQLASQLVVDYGKPNPLTGKITSDEKIKLATETMKRYNLCADVGFSPCQFRIGFWLANSPRNIESAIPVIRTAVKSTISDPRYGDSTDAFMILAANILLFHRDKYLMSDEERKFYEKLVAPLS